MQERNHEARFYEKLENGNVCCGVCPRRCTIVPGNAGYCAVRENTDGVLYSRSYGYPVALQIDPIEKKPLQHYMAGTRTFSIGAFGCNLGCVFCQNDHLSRGFYRKGIAYRYYEPVTLVELAVKHGCESVSFTYNEPSVWVEYAMDIAREAKAAGLGVVLVSNAYMELEVAKEFYPLIDAANVDVKGFSEDFYNEMCKATLAPLKATCEFYKNELDGELELTNLVIPGKNSSREMIDAYLDWVGEKLGIDTPLHFTAYHPAYKYDASPRTPRPMLDEIQEYAKNRGFRNVYLGNIC